MKRGAATISIVLFVLAWGCDGSNVMEDAGPRVDGAVPMTDGGGADSGLPPGDGGPPADGGVVMIVCTDYEGPNLIVTRDDALHGRSSALFRISLELDAAVTGLAILALDEVLDGAPIRSVDPGVIRGPDGFDGRVTPSPGDPRPGILFTAVTNAAAAELAECDLDPWARHTGSVDVRLRTDQTGEVVVHCGLGSSYAGRGPEPVRLACARGVPGWVGSSPRISDITTPSVFRFMESPMLAHDSGAVPVDGFVATGATIRSTVRTFTGEMPCADPAEWTATGGTHQLWRGSSSVETWSGPVAPGAEERANWMWQEMGSLPAGFCFPPGVGPPDECLHPTLFIALRGSSSAGAWEWESDIFDCLDL